MTSIPQTRWRFGRLSSGRTNWRAQSTPPHSLTVPRLMRMEPSTLTTAPTIQFREVRRSIAGAVVLQPLCAGAQQGRSRAPGWCGRGRVRACAGHYASGGVDAGARAGQRGRAVVPARNFFFPAAAPSRGRGGQEVCAILGSHPSPTTPPRFVRGLGDTREGKKTRARAPHRDGGPPGPDCWRVPGKGRRRHPGCPPPDRGCRWWRRVRRKQRRQRWHGLDVGPAMGACFFLVRRGSEVGRCERVRADPRTALCALPQTVIDVLA